MKRQKGVSGTGGRPWCQGDIHKGKAIRLGLDKKDKVDLGPDDPKVEETD